MNKYVVILIVLFSIVITEEKTYSFTETEVQTFRSSIIELEKKDSLNIDIIKSLEHQILNYELQMQNDSLIINQLELKTKLQADLVKLVKPKWYENKYLWFFGGFLSFYLATDAVNNLK